MNNINYTRASSNEELKQILQIQHDNTVQAVSSEEKQNEGFVTVKHDLALLKRMNDASPHSIAKDGEKVVGYALHMLKTFRSDIEVLLPMFTLIDEALPDANYVVMGQICIAKDYRKQGIFKGLYQFMKDELRHKFDMTVTAIDGANLRSLNAHAAVGFKTLKKRTVDRQNWELVYWDWR